MGMIEPVEREGFIVTTIRSALEWVDAATGGGVSKVINVSRKNSLWPYVFGTACCSIEMMAALSSRFDMARFGAEVIRFSPRQADLMIVGGRVTLKMLPVLQRIWLQMPEPKWCISMGACASCGGVFDTYTMVQGVDRFIPVDVYVPGCPPRPENMIDALLMIQRKIDQSRVLGGRGKKQVGLEVPPERAARSSLPVVRP